MVSWTLVSKYDRVSIAAYSKNSTMNMKRKESIKLDTPHHNLGVNIATVKKKEGGTIYSCINWHGHASSLEEDS